MTENWNPWNEPPTDDELDLYYRWQSNLHDYKAGNDEYGRCVESYTLRDGTVRTCGMSSHSTTHNPLPCCHCKHGVYLHTSYDIPCGRCESESEGYF